MKYKVHIMERNIYLRKLAKEVLLITFYYRIESDKKNCILIIFLSELIKINMKKKSIPPKYGFVK